MNHLEKSINSLKRQTLCIMLVVLIQVKLAGADNKAKF